MTGGQMVLMALSPEEYGKLRQNLTAGGPDHIHSASAAAFRRLFATVDERLALRDGRIAHARAILMLAYDALDDGESRPALCDSIAEFIAPIGKITVEDLQWAARTLEAAEALFAADPAEPEVRP